MSNQNQKSTQPATRAAAGAATKPLTADEREALIKDAAQRKAADEAAVKQTSGEKKSRVTAPWVDLEPTSDKPAQPREKTVFAVYLAEIAKRPDGATLEEMKEALKSLPGSGADGTMYHHDPKSGLRWQHANKGWGFRMDPKTQRITVWEKGKK